MNESTNIRGTILKTLLAVAAFILILVIIPGCSEGSSNSVSAVDIQADVISSVEDILPEMTTVNSDSEDAETLFSYFCDIDYSKVSSFFLTASSEGLADEIAVIELKDASDVSATEDSLNEHIMSRVSMYSYYLPDQTERAEHGVVGHEGNYVYLTICDNSEAVISAIRNAVN